MLPDFPIKTMSDLELVFITLAVKAQAAGVKMPQLRGSLENWCKYIFRNFGTYHGNPFDVLGDHLIKAMDAIIDERDASDGKDRHSFNLLHHDIHIIFKDIIYYTGTWNLLNE